MLPILYDETETEFKNNGIGRLSDLISCTVREKKNDTYTLDMTYPVKGKHFNDLKPGKIIFAIHDNSKTGQPFDITSVSAPSNGRIRVTAQHISYRLKRLYCIPEYILIGQFGPDAVISELNRKDTPPSLSVIGNNQFDITCELESGEYPVYPNAPNVYESSTYTPVYDILFDSSTGILSDDKGWGSECGEYIRDKFSVKLVKHRGSDKGIQMRTGKNVQLLTVSYDMENYYTGAVPYWDGKDPVSGESMHLDLRNFDAYDSGIVSANSDFPYDRLIPVDLSGMFEQPPTEQEMRDEASRYLKNASDRSAAYPQSYAIDLVHNPDNTAEMQSADLCDFVQVQDVTLGVNVNLEVTEVTYDVVHERYTSMVVGNKRKTISKLIKDKFESPLAKDVSALSAQVSDLAVKTTVDNKIYPTTYDPSDPESWEGGTGETLYDADGNEVEQVATVNRAPVFAHKSGGSGGGTSNQVMLKADYVRYTSFQFTCKGYVVGDFTGTNPLDLRLYNLYFDKLQVVFDKIEVGAKVTALVTASLAAEQSNTASGQVSGSLNLTMNLKAEITAISGNNVTVGFEIFNFSGFTSTQYMGSTVIFVAGSGTGNPSDYDFSHTFDTTYEYY